MTEALVLELIPRHIEMLGIKKYHIHYLDLYIKANAQQEIKAYNDLYFVIGDPEGIVIESDYGRYESATDNTSDNAHVHRGEIIITSKQDEAKRIKFIQVILVS